VAASDEQALDELWPHYRDVLTRVGKTRGWAPPRKDQFRRETGPQGAWCVGSPETVAGKIAANLPALRATRFDLKYGTVGLSHDTVMTASSCTAPKWSHLSAR
jgi:alkanesulfonate monooxygenase SsuD/methylene tetrahydromethanopterin reductase-like flavin-dependent oxidoreductase (luciferase family)